jgi:hypothetical protein
MEYATLGWNVVGCVVLALTAVAAGSVALAGFGIDSLIEILAFHDGGVAAARHRHKLENRASAAGHIGRVRVARDLDRRAVSDGSRQR